VVEPLADLYKVEVRELGERLGIPREAVWRHPFPGPGLGVRLLCSDGEEDLEDLDTLAPIVEEIAAGWGLSATALPIRSVGVKADLRSYERPVALAGRADQDAIFGAAAAILEKIHGINRCIWLVGDRPSSVHPVAATTTRERLDLLREADHIVMEGLRRHGLYERIWQCPTVLVPLSVDGRGSELVIVRPVLSERAMTAAAARLPEALIGELADRIPALEGVSGLAFDLTSKPPGTIEWE